MRRAPHFILLLLLLPTASCKHNLDSLYAGTVDASARSGSGGKTGSGTGGSDSEDDGGPGGGGSGGGGVEPPPPGPCEPCEKLSSELEDRGVSNCCRGIAKRTCGLVFEDSSACLPREVPGRAESKCADARDGTLKLDGCCRPDARCGYKATGPVLGVFGCVAREEIPKDFASIDTTPIACTYECETDDDCNALPGDFVCTENPENGSQRICAKKCSRDGDCAKDRICALGNDVAMNRVNAFCQEPVGAADPGEFCSSARDCGTGVCVQDPSDAKRGLCTQLCLNDPDCQDGQECGLGGIKTPDEKSVQQFSICNYPKAAP